MSILKIAAITKKGKNALVCAANFSRTIQPGSPGSLSVCGIAAEIEWERSLSVSCPPKHLLLRMEDP